MGRFTLLAIAQIVCCRIALADPVARAAFLRDFPLRSDRLATFRPGVDAEPILAPATSAAGLRTLKQSERELAAAGMELGEPGSVGGEIGPGLFDENGELVFGGGAQEALETLLRQTAEAIPKAGEEARIATFVQGRHFLRAKRTATFAHLRVLVSSSSCLRPYGPRPYGPPAAARQRGFLAACSSSRNR